MALVETEHPEKAVNHLSDYLPGIQITLSRAADHL